MAAFTARDPPDEEAFGAHWARLLADASIVKRSVLYEGRVAGSVLAFERDGTPEVCYWLGREYWGRGIATAALRQFLGIVTARPLYARVAKDNVASVRVLEKCGFAVCGEDRGFAGARGEEVEELILQLPAGPPAAG